MNNTGDFKTKKKPNTSGMAGHVPPQSEIYRFWWTGKNALNES
jgi:hypothetical protein